LPSNDEDPTDYVVVACLVRVSISHTSETYQKTARALGLTVSDKLFASADEVIE
jgi:hypothetical protein